MNDGDLLVLQLKALQHQCLGLAHSIETVLAVTARESAPPAAVADACVHPRAFRVDIAAMGKPHRFLCRACGQEGVDERVQEED